MLCDSPDSPDSPFFRLFVFSKGVFILFFCCKSGESGESFFIDRNYGLVEKMNIKIMV